MVTIIIDVILPAFVLVILVLYVTKVLIPLWNEKALRKKQIKYIGKLVIEEYLKTNIVFKNGEFTTSKPNIISAMDGFLPINDSGVYGDWDWSEGPESEDELN